MSCLGKLDQAISLAEQELAALDRGDAESADTLSEERVQLLDEAWQMRDTVKVALMQERLQTLYQLQMTLTGKALNLKEDMIQQMNTNRKEFKRLNAYHRAVQAHL